MKAQFLRPGYFVWIVIPVALYLTYLAIGLPHFIWSYDWRDNGKLAPAPAKAGDPFAKRHYTRCTFIGPYGDITTYPINGKCGWIVFRRGNS